MSKTHQFGVKAFILPFIEIERKSLEIRVADEKRKGVRQGDFITFNNQIKRKVIAIRNYSSFEVMLKSEDSERIMPGWGPIKILAELRDVYTPRQEALGVLVFQLQVDP